MQYSRRLWQDCRPGRSRRGVKLTCSCGLQVHSFPRTSQSFDLPRAAAAHPAIDSGYPEVAGIHRSLSSVA